MEVLMMVVFCGGLLVVLLYGLSHDQVVSTMPGEHSCQHQTNGTLRLLNYTPQGRTSPILDSNLTKPQSINRPSLDHQFGQCLHHILGYVSLGWFRGPSTAAPRVDKYCYCRYPSLAPATN